MARCAPDRSAQGSFLQCRRPNQTSSDHHCSGASHGLHMSLLTHRRMTRAHHNLEPIAPNSQQRNPLRNSVLGQGRRWTKALWGYSYLHEHTTQWLKVHRWWNPLVSTRVPHWIEEMLGCSNSLITLSLSLSLSLSQTHWHPKKEEKRTQGKEKKEGEEVSRCSTASLCLSISNLPDSFPGVAGEKMATAWLSQIFYFIQLFTRKLHKAPSLPSKLQITQTTPKSYARECKCQSTMIASMINTIRSNQTPNHQNT